MMATTGVVYPTIIGFDKLILIALSMNKFMKMKSKIQYFFLAGMMLLGGVLATSGCQKENDREGIPEGAVLITAEGFGGMEGKRGQGKPQWCRLYRHGEWKQGLRFGLQQP